MQDFVGKNIGRYHVIERQGMGGMAVVYHAYDNRLDRDVALKLIRTDSMPPDLKEQLLKRFEREAKAQARFSHPNIVPVYDYGEVDDAPYLVMEYIPDGTLKERIGKPMPYKQALQWIIPIADALSYAHERGIIHRDIKPSNILITVKNRPVLTDFGIAKLLESQEATQLTSTGMGVGTPEYMAPEQWHGKAFPQTDIYALAVVLYELLTGTKPYKADTPAAVAILQATEPLPRPSILAPDLPEKVEKLLYKALARDPQDRFESMEAFQQALEALQNERSTTVSEISPGEKAALFNIPDGDEAPTQIVSNSSANGVRLNPQTKPSMQQEALKTSQAMTAPPSVPLEKQKGKFPAWILFGGIGLVLVMVLLGLGISWVTRGLNGSGPLAMLAASTSTSAAIATKTSPPVDAVENTQPPTEAVENNEAPAVPEETLFIGVVTDVGEVDDKSFNQSAWEGAQQAAAELGGHAEYIETRDSKDYATNIGLFAESGYNVIITVGFALGDATREAAAKYPDIYFIGVDQYQDPVITNIAGLMFPEWNAGFQAGALAGMLTKSKLLAGVYGTDLVPAVVAFGEGYEDGAHYIDPAIEVITTYHPGGYATGFTDPEWGAATAKQAIEQGADVVFGAGGKTGNGALIETANYDGALCIGVDTDQWETVPEAHACLVSSAMKLIVPGVFDLVKMAKANVFPAGNYFGTVGLAAFHDFDRQIPQDIKDTLAQIEADLLSGKINYADFH